LSSLDKVSDFDVDFVLPGHRRLILDHHARIGELKKHHAHRLAEVLTILEHAPMTAFEVASKMTWDLKCDDWKDFPVAQRWFATGEAISHIRLLEEEGKVGREAKGGLTRFGLAK
jgi:hypothetical protein